MKILIIQEKGRHIKNEAFREALNFHRAFRKIGTESTVWGLNYPNFNTPFDKMAKNYDIILLIENYDNGWLPDISKFKGLKIFWSIDSHVMPTQHRKTCEDNKIDIVLNAIESHKNIFPGKKCYYLPNAYPNDLIYPMGIKKTINIGFVGNYVNRKDWVDHIPGIEKNIMVIGNDMVKKINSFKIHFNRNMAEDINYRTFETLGCKTFLLTNHTENLEKLFDVKNDLITYTTKKDLTEKVEYYLNNPAERDRIALNGYKKVKEYHTYINRAQEILNIINL